jgi:hypothetical protein
MGNLSLRLRALGRIVRLIRRITFVNDIQLENQYKPEEGDPMRRVNHRFFGKFS